MSSSGTVFEKKEDRSNASSNTDYVAQAYKDVVAIDFRDFDGKGRYSIATLRKILNIPADISDGDLISHLVQPRSFKEMRTIVLNFLPALMVVDKDAVQEKISNCFNDMMRSKTPFEFAVRYHEFLVFRYQKTEEEWRLFVPLYPVIECEPKMHSGSSPPGTLVSPLGIFLVGEIFRYNDYYVLSKTLDRACDYELDANFIDNPKVYFGYLKRLILADLKLYDLAPGRDVSDAFTDALFDGIEQLEKAENSEFPGIYVTVMSKLQGLYNRSTVVAGTDWLILSDKQIKHRAELLNRTLEAPLALSIAFYASTPDQFVSLNSSLWKIILEYCDAYGASSATLKSYESTLKAKQTLFAHPPAPLTGTKQVTRHQRSLSN